MVGWGLLCWSQVSVDQSSRKFNKTIINIKRRKEKKTKKKKEKKSMEKELFRASLYVWYLYITNTGS